MTHGFVRSRAVASRRSLSSLLAVCATVLALPACALAARPAARRHPGTASRASFKVSARIPNHTPIVGRPWRITLYVTSGKAKLRGSVRYEFLYDGSVVSHQPGHRFAHGVFHDTLRFPPASLGEPLTLRILVSVPGRGTEHIDWAVRTKRAS